ncbi:DUF1015 domain-containing protein [Blastococcus xanthinilyticus]|uniref:Uncharacterized protein (DUF1015 family) n=1 Tax=Blastococcus xanthinilyticus TaxID=1564164 RepID=A0A5S5CLC4_9ACTN|nr:DUF1015 domain-containing protein [Blastococcus xanthinilyticus]TYP81987.1 uncharacterized protein (DUF1015 family) [Blastococcus xanthinilyticus]
MLSSSAGPRAASPPVPGLEVRPFRALTYGHRNGDALARVSSPAYDLVSPARRDQLAQADPHNIVRLILPRATTGGGGETVEEAARTLRDWEASGVLERDADPALWLYELQPADGVPATVGWLGAVTLPPEHAPSVLPHEDTYPAAVEGRRALLAATQTDLEPIVLAHDPEPEVAELAEAVRQTPPTMELLDTDGVRHRLWRVADPAVHDSVGRALRRTGAVIADGHHRFAAARANARAQRCASGTDAVLALVTPMGPGGLRVDPIHRVVPDLGLPAAVAAAGHGFVTADVPVDGAEAAAVVAAARAWLGDPAERGLLLTDGRRLVRLSAASTAVRAAVPVEAPASWRDLDVVLAHHGLMGHLWGRPDTVDSVLIAHSLEEAVRTAAERSGVAVLLRAPSPTDVAAVARAGARMPRKSTLFVPKPRTGLVLRPLGG